MKTKSRKETQKYAQDLAKKLSQDVPERNDALVIALYGEFGSGKTTFAQGFARGFGIEEKVLSPTFVIIKSYKIPDTNYKPKNLVHIDCYRIEDENDLKELGWDSIVSDPKNIVLIEWPERIKNILSEETINMYFKVIKETVREISFAKTTKK